MLLDSSWCIHKRWNWCHPRHLQSNEQLTVAADAGPKVMPWLALNSNNSQSPKGIPGKGTPMAREASAAKGDRRGRRGLSLKAHCQKSISFHNCCVHSMETLGWLAAFPTLVTEEIRRKSAFRRLAAASKKREKLKILSKFGLDLVGRGSWLELRSRTPVGGHQSICATFLGS